MDKVILITLGKVLENQAAILCALMNDEGSYVLRAILERNVSDTKEVMTMLRAIVEEENTEKGEKGNADAQDQAE